MFLGKFIQIFDKLLKMSILPRFPLLVIRPIDLNKENLWNILVHSLLRDKSGRTVSYNYFHFTFTSPYTKTVKKL